MRASDEGQSSVRVITAVSAPAYPPEGTEAIMAEPPPIRITAIFVKSVAAILLLTAARVGLA